MRHLIPRQCCIQQACVDVKMHKYTFYYTNKITSTKNIFPVGVLELKYIMLCDADANSL